ncbi:hypothetical protein [Candidatus Nitrospira salsa]
MKGFGPFGKKYITPLRAFLSMEDDQERIKEVLERGLTIEFVRNSLSEILSKDPYLQKCCGNIDGLAHTLDVLFFNLLPDETFHEPISLPDRNIEDFDRQLYKSGEFAKYAFFHLFNFTSSNDDLPQPPYPDWKILQMESRVIAQLLGENTFLSFLSPPDAGNYFLVAPDTEGFNVESLSEWLNRRWNDSSPFRQILQYSRDGIVDIDYVVPYFNPPWVNLIQRRGIYYSGMPRQHPTTPHLEYLLLPGDKERIKLLWLLYQRHADRISSMNTTLRKAISTAGDFYEDCHKKANRIEQFSNLIIALEALYTPSDKGELTFRISQSCSLLLGDNSDSMKNTFEFLKSMFRKRGKLFHGQYSPSTNDPEKFLKSEDLLRLISLVRQSILKFLTLYVSGETDIKKVRKDIENAILDSDFRSEFLEKADFERFLELEQRQSENSCI